MGLAGWVGCRALRLLCGAGLPLARSGSGSLWLCTGSALGLRACASQRRFEVLDSAAIATSDRSVVNAYLVNPSHPVRRGSCSDDRSGEMDLRVRKMEAKKGTGWRWKG